MRRLLLTLCVLAAASSAQSAARPPQDASEEIKTRAMPVFEDFAQGVVTQAALRRTPHRTLAEARPWDDLAAYCAIPRLQRANLVGDFVAAHVELPAPARNLRSTVRIMGEADREFTRRINRIAERFPTEGQGQFLAAGQTLRSRPAGWGDALTQRAEWALVLHTAAGELRTASVGSVDFRANYAAAVWSAVECDYISRHAAFLTDIQASGEAVTGSRQQAALDFLRRFRAPSA